MAKTFDPNRVLPGTIELVRDANGNYTTKVVGLETINSLSLPEISTTAAVTKTDTDTKTATEITGDTIQSQTQQAFKTFDRDDGDRIDTTGNMLQQATKLSRNLSDFNPDTASEQFARQTILPGTFDAETFDETEDKVSIKDPTESVFGRSTLDDEQRARQTTLPDLNVAKPDLNVAKKTNRVTSADVQAGRAEPPGFDFSFLKGLKGDKFKQGTPFNNPVGGVDQIAREVEDLEATKPNQTITVDELQGSLKDLYKNKMNLPGNTKLNIVPDDIDFRTLGISAEPSKTRAAKEADFASGTLGITADPVKSTFGTAVDQEQGFTDIDRFKGISQEGALAGEGEKQDVKPVKRKALETISTSLRTTKDSILSNIKTPVMALLEAVVAPESNIQKLNKSYFTDRGDGRIGGNPATDLYAGFNRTSAFGNLEKAGDKRISTREKTIAKKGYRPGDKFYDDTQKMKEQAKAYKKQKAATQKATQGPAGQGGASGTDSGKSKIVCTMMNESYGFGSFRNKIWMKFHGNIAPEYQKGYHKLFLPLVKYAKQKGIINKIIKNILEHIAVHSTIDMRQTLRGKRHTLGRLYRKVILPLCYWAGKK